MGRNVKIIEQTGGSTTDTKQFIWCEEERCEQRDNSSAVSARFFSDGQIVAGLSRLFTTDHLGSVRDKSNDSGNLVSQHSFGPYGQSERLYGFSNSDLEYAGYYLHSRSDLLLPVYRAYAPRLGRWMTRDPILEAGGLNLYCYVLNNPILDSDPLGLANKLSPCSEDMSCCELAQRIVEYTRDCNKRFRHLSKDRKKLPLFGKKSIAGHAQQLAQNQTHLINCMYLFLKKCHGPIDPNSWEISTRPIPWPVAPRKEHPFFVPIPVPGTPYNWPGIQTPLGPLPLIPVPVGPIPVLI